MKKALLFLFCSVLSLPVYPLGWISLHEKADGVSAAAAENIAKKTNAPDDWYIYGLACLNEYQDGEAQTAFEKVASLDNTSVEARWGLAEATRRRHEEKAARAQLEAIIKEQPQFSPAYISLAYIDYTEGKFSDAVKAAQFVIDQGEKSVDRNNYSRAHLIFAGAKGMIAHNGGPIVKVLHGTQVLPNLKRAQRILPDSAQVYFGLGAFYLLAPGLVGGDVAMAQQYLMKAIAIDPKFADAYVRLAQSYKVQGNNAKYEYYLNKALEIDPKNVLANDVKTKACRFICVDTKD